MLLFLFGQWSPWSRIHFFWGNREHACDRPLSNKVKLNIRLLFLCQNLSLTVKCKNLWEIPLQHTKFHFIAAYFKIYLSADYIIEYVYLLLLCQPLRKLISDKCNLMASIESICISGYFGKVKKSSHKLTITSWLKVIERKQRIEMRINSDHGDDSVSLSGRTQGSSITSYLPV